MADVLGRSDRGSWARAQWRRSPPYCCAIVCAAARVASCPHRRLILHAHAPVRGVACAYTYMCICIYAYVYACEPLTCHMLGVACECVRLDLGWPYRHSRARNAQGSLCICHVGLSRKWGSIPNVRSLSAVVRSGTCPLARTTRAYTWASDGRGKSARYVLCARGRMPNSIHGWGTIVTPCAGLAQPLYYTRPPWVHNLQAVPSVRDHKKKNWGTLYRWAKGTGTRGALAGLIRILAPLR